MAKNTEADLREAGIAMMLADYDYRDNQGSTDAVKFWLIFVEKRSVYRVLRDGLPK